MAKAGFWLRGAKGKLAGASMGKGANGQTIMREIVTPKNPRTNAQLMQRAIMATVMQAYSAGKAIFDHSFQGKSVGAQNQQRFMSLNARLIRSIIAEEVGNATPVLEQVGRVVAPGISSPVPATFQVSEGTLVNTLVPNGVTPAQASMTETVAEYCARLGLRAGDLFTFVAFVVPANASELFILQTDNSPYSKQYGAQFIYARYQVKAEALASTALAYRSYLDDILELTEANFTPNALHIGNPLSEYTLGVVYPGSSQGTFAWIRSRFDEDLRSTEKMVFEGKDFGICSTFALDAWRQGSANLGDSSLILEGGNFDGGSSAAMTSLPALTTDTVNAMTAGQSIYGVYKGSVRASNKTIVDPMFVINKVGNELTLGVCGDTTEHCITANEYGSCSVDYSSAMPEDYSTALITAFTTALPGVTFVEGAGAVFYTTAQAEAVIQYAVG